MNPQIETTPKPEPQTICLNYGNGTTETITTHDPEETKRIYGAKEYVVLDD